MKKSTKYILGAGVVLVLLYVAYRSMGKANASTGSAAVGKPRPTEAPPSGDIHFGTPGSDEFSEIKVFPTSTATPGYM